MDTELTMDNKIAQVLKNSDALPRAPEALVEKTILRMEVVSKGVAAERQLSELSDEKARGRADPLKITALAAQSLVGRMAQHRELPPGFSRDEAQNLAKDASFQKMIGEKKPDEILKELDNGTLVKSAAKISKKIPASEGRDLNIKNNMTKAQKPITK